MRHGFGVKMIVMYLEGGLGNLLFQVSTAQSVAFDNAIEDVFYLNIEGNFSKIQREHGSDIEGYKKSFLRHLKLSEPPMVYQPQIIHEGTFEYKPLHYEPGCYNIYKGYFQSEKFFAHNDSRLLELFSPSEEIVGYIQNKYSFLNDLNCISLHIRRGDYKHLPLHHPILPIEYYKKSLLNHKEYDKILVFTNDIQWCYDNLVDSRAIFIDENEWTSLYIMSMCQQHIIANSSFSWWGAKLAELFNPDKEISVTYPSLWFGPAIQGNTQDICPDRWQKCII